MDDLLLTAVGPAFLVGAVVLAAWVDLREARAARAALSRPGPPVLPAPPAGAALGGGPRLRLVHDADR
jgi:hypothetical protein